MTTTTTSPSEASGATLLQHASAEARLARAREWLLTHPPGTEVLVVGASLEAAHELLARAVAGNRPGASFGWHRTTLPLLAERLSETTLAGAGKVPLSSLGAEAVTARVVAELGGGGPGLGRYAPVAGTPGFVRALAACLAELRLARLGEDEVRPVAPDLARLLAAYGARLEQAGLADRAGTLAVAAEVAADRDRRHPLLGHPTLLLDVPVRCEAERRLVGALLERAPAALVTLAAGDERGAGSLFSAPYSIPLEYGGRQGAPVPDTGRAGAADEGPEEAAAGTALRRLQAHLFRDTSPPEGEEDETLAIFSAPGENRECVEIARKALEHAAAGVPFDRMAVLLRTPADYRAHLEEALERAGIPAHFERGVIRPDPAGRAFLALLRCRREGYSARRFAEYLSLGQVPAEVGDDAVRHGTLRAPRRWERLLVEASVVGGLDRWRRRLDGLEEELRLALGARDREEDGAVAALERKIEDLGHLRGHALPLLGELEALPEEGPWEVWLERLATLASRALRAPARVTALLEEMAPLGPVGPVDLAEVIRVLSSHLLELALPPEGARWGRLFVGSAEAARGRSFDVVFVPGLAERLFPRDVAEDPILLDEARERISSSVGNANGLGIAARLRTQEDRIAEERLALRLAVGAARDRLVLSYPRMDVGQSRPRVPSFYALESLRSAEGRLPLFEDLAARADAVTEARVGWPAPPEPDRAIDAAEYDLAVLESLHGEAPSAGAAHYLLAANPHLGRSLRARAYRWLVRRWSAADGLVLDPGGEGDGVDAVAAEALAGYRLNARPASATALQNFATCPYKYFLHAVHRLEPREAPEAIETLDPLQRGALIHDIQFACLSRLEEEGLLPVRPANLAAALERLDAAVDRVAAEYRERLVPAIERVWEDGIEAIRADLRRWLREVARDASGFVPWRFELSFGLPGRAPQDPHSRPEPVRLEPGLRLRGAIDLVERREEDGAIRVTDHKTGRARVSAGAIVDGGAALQPVLYALAAERLFPDARVVAGRLYYCTSTGEYRSHEVPLDEDARAAIARVVELVGGEVERGFLPALPREGACRWCDYRAVCGPWEERRTARKDARRTRAIEALRELR